MTVRQAQYLLLYLGYDPGEADGIAGAKTAQAVAEFQREYGGLTADGRLGPQTGNALIEAVQQRFQRPAAEETAVSTADPVGGTFWDTVKYFSREEFRCRCGKCGGFPAEPERKLVQLADGVRAHFGREAQVSSGVRCRKHNAAVGGVANSRHLTGKAMDFSIPGVSGEILLAYVKAQPGVNYAYHIGGGFVHMDVA